MYFTYAKTEYFIVFGRLILAAFFLFIFWFFSIEPFENIATVFTLLVIYFIYSALLLCLNWWKKSLRWYEIITYSIDLLVLTILINLTGSLTSPFLPFLFLLLLIATLHWNYRGILLAATFIFILYAISAIITTSDRTSLNSTMIINLTYITVFLGMTTLLVFINFHEQRWQKKYAKLSDISKVGNIPITIQIQEILKIISDIFQVTRVLLIWKETDKSWCHIATLHHDDFQLIRESSENLEPIVAEPLTHFHFIRPDSPPIQRMFFLTEPYQVRTWQGNPLNHQLEIRFTIGRTLSLNLPGSVLSGRLFILDMRHMTIHHLRMGDLIAQQVLAALEQWHLQSRLQQEAVLQERLHVARELHDGLLQALTGINLQVAIIRRLIETSAEAAQERLSEIQALLTDEQRELRLFVQQLKSVSPELPQENAQLSTRLEVLKAKMARQWKLAVSVRVPPLPQNKLSTQWVHEVYRLIQEALVNAVRHGNASTARVEVSTHSNQLYLVVEDNGSGFPFQGHYDLATLNELQQGPVSIKERISLLQGNLIIDSSQSGSRLEITLPLLKTNGKTFQ